MRTSWTSAADIVAKARRSWLDDSVPAAYLRGDPCPRLELPVRGPAVREIGPNLARVRTWRDELHAGSRHGCAYTVIERAVGGRVIGHLTLPDRVSVSEYEQWWRLLGVGAQIRALDEVAAVTERRQPALMRWVTRRPRTAIDLSPEWPRLLAAIDWLAASAGTGRYLREVTAAGVDTKFIERHQRVLSEWLDMLRPETVDLRVPVKTIATRHGFAVPERLVRLRVDQALHCLPPGVEEIGLRLDAAATLALEPADVLVVENQVTYLSAPVPPAGVVLWGHGFDAGRLGRMPWLSKAGRLRYWGDLDTHGFAILHQLRSQQPRTGSVLMDLDTLLAHRDRWVCEGAPSRADLGCLTGEERRVYDELVEDVHGHRVRLEQERVDWSWALRELAS